MQPRFLSRIVIVSILLLAASVLCAAQLTFGLPTTPAKPAQSPAIQTSPSQPTSKQLEIAAGSSNWTDTGIDVRVGDKLAITSDGTLSLLQGGIASPDGLARTWRDTLRALPVNSAGSGALIARIGDNPAVVPFLVGAKKEVTISRPGRLFLGINLDSKDQFTGGYKVSLQLTPREKSDEQPITELEFDNSLFDQIPRRIMDKNGGAGDMVNFLLIGTADDLQKTFASGGWVQVDRTVKDAILSAVLATTKNSAYLEMPMSELYLFGRPQDFGFARADPVMVVQERHHLRIWKAPFTFKDHEVWVGAATHDIGFERDQRNGSVTHKIDPDVDVEREFVRASLTEGGGVLSDVYCAPNDPVREAKTATGGSFHSDGRVLIMQLRSTATTPAIKAAGN